MVQKGTARTRWHYCCTGSGEVTVISTLGIGTLLHCEKKEMAQSLFVCHLPQLSQVKALLRALHYQLGLNAFAFSIQDCSSSSGCLQMYRAAFPNNVQGHIFRQILCCFCSSQILFYHCSGMWVFKPSVTLMEFIQQSW